MSSIIIYKKGGLAKVLMGMSFKNNSNITNMFYSIVKRIPLISITSLIIILLSSILINYSSNNMRNDIYRNQIISKDKSFQSFLDSSSILLEEEYKETNTLYNMLFEHFEEKSSIDKFNKVNNLMTNSFNEYSRDIKLYTFVITVNPQSYKTLYIVYDEKLYKVIEFKKNKYIMLNTQFDHFNINNMDTETYNRLVKSEDIIQDISLLDSKLIERMLIAKRTSINENKEFIYNNTDYYYNISYLPQRDYLKGRFPPDISQSYKRKLGFMILYDREYITKSLEGINGHLKHIEGVIDFTLYVNAIVCILQLIYGLTLYKKNVELVSNNIKKCK